MQSKRSLTSWRTRVETQKGQKWVETGVALLTGQAELGASIVVLLGIGRVESVDRVLGGEDLDAE